MKKEAARLCGNARMAGKKSRINYNKIVKLYERTK